MLGWTSGIGRINSDADLSCTSHCSCVACSRVAFFVPGHGDHGIIGLATMIVLDPQPGTVRQVLALYAGIHPRLQALLTLPI